MHFLACSECHEVIMKSLSSEIKIRAKVMIMKEGTMFAVCKGCSSEIPVPLVLDRELAKSLASTDTNEPRLYLKR